MKIGIMTTSHYIASTTGDLKRVIKLHEVEELRRSFIMSREIVQTDFMAFRILSYQDVDIILPILRNLQKKF